MTRWARLRRATPLGLMLAGLGCHRGEAPPGVDAGMTSPERPADGGRSRVEVRVEGAGEPSYVALSNLQPGRPSPPPKSHSPFTFPDVEPGRYQITAGGPGFETVRQVETLDAPVREVVMTSTPYQALEGTVHDPEGRPVPEAEVTVSEVTSGCGTGAFGARVQTDPGGLVPDRRAADADVRGGGRCPGLSS